MTGLYKMGPRIPLQGQVLAAITAQIVPAKVLTVIGPSVSGTSTLRASVNPRGLPPKVQP